MTREDITELGKAFVRRDQIAWELSEARSQNDRARQRFDQARQAFEEAEHTLNKLCERLGVKPGQARPSPKTFSPASYAQEGQPHLVNVLPRSGDTQRIP